MKKKKKEKTIKYLRERADSLYQQVGKRLMPFSIISGKPTEVIHHFFTKQSSSRLRYELQNGVPLTFSEHFAHHIKSDPTIHARIIQIRGDLWYQTLNTIRRDTIKADRQYYEKVYEQLSSL